MLYSKSIAVRLKEDGKSWILLEPVEFESQQFNVQVQVPVGFETDFASVPKLFLPLLKWKDKFNTAAVVHDYLYQHPDGLTRKQVDQIFFEAMGYIPINPLKKRIFYLFVRMFGWIMWKKYRKREKKRLN